MNLKELKEKRNNKVEDMNNIVEKALTEERAMTEEELAKFDEVKKSVNDLDETIKRAEESEEKTLTETSEDGDEKKEDDNKEERAADDVKLFAACIRNAIEERADANLTKGANGSIVPTTIADKIIQKVYDISPILEKATKYNKKGKLIVPLIKNNDDSINMAYAEEFSDLEATKKDFDGITLDDFLAGALSKISNSLINSTDIDLVEKVIELMSVDCARFMEKEGLYGTENKVKGCSTVSLIVTPTSASAITADNLIDLKNKVKQVYRKNAFYVMNQETKGVVEKLKDENGNYLFNPCIKGAFDGNILGYPVFVSDAADNIEAGKTPIFFGDFSGLALKQSKEMELQVLREIYATQHATGIVLWNEFDIQVENLQKIAKLNMPNA